MWRFAVISCGKTWISPSPLLRISAEGLWGDINHQIDINLTFNHGSPVPNSTSAIVSPFHNAKDFLFQHYTIVVIGAMAARLIYLCYLSPYCEIPGPFLATISPFWRLRWALNGTLHKDITAAHKKVRPNLPNCTGWSLHIWSWGNQNHLRTWDWLYQGILFLLLLNSAKLI